MCAAIILCVFRLGSAIGMAAETSRGEMLIVVGSPGTDEYRQLFQGWAGKWTAAARTGKLEVVTLGVEQDDATLLRLREALAHAAETPDLPLWVVLIGHGTFDGRNAKFNLPEADLEPAELARLLDAVHRPLAVIDCSSASGPFLKALAKENRVVITAATSGDEVNLAHFGGYLAEAVSDPAADLDKDQQTSLLEAFLQASRKTEEFYAGDGRLPTEHALLEDNGDGRGIPWAGFDGLRPQKRTDDPQLLPDGLAAHQWHLIPGDADAALPPEIIIRRNEIEKEIARLRAQKAQLSEDGYYAALEPLFLELAKLLTAPPQAPAGK
jgi:hypothetical protein